ncbi:MAG: protein kinase [Acidobacteria bacterium]|nr:protein kinase [Acidobacteriota bacterium]
MRELSLSNSRLDRRYDVSKRLGQGSYAEIFVAKDTLASPQSPHSTVVVKALNVFLQEDVDLDLERTLVENFQNEAVALDRVRHPNIISRLGHGTARDLAGVVFHYLVLEYMAGGDIQSLIRHRPLRIDAALKYAEQACAGLAHAHSRGIIHRDIKPQNLLLTEDLVTLKIADFGVARFSAADSPITRVGTNIYAPPEHSPAYFSDTAERLTPAADIYSLAKTVYTIITREPPRAYTGGPIEGLPASSNDEEWSDSLLEVLNRATADDPSRRPQSVEEFWFDLGPVLNIVGDMDPETVVNRTADLPQPHVSRGYTPLVPEQPSFEAVLKVNTDASPREPRTPIEAFPQSKAVLEYPAYQPIRAEQPNLASPVESSVPPPPARKRGFKGPLRRLAIFLAFAAIFTGALYGTAVYFKNSGLIDSVRNTFSPKIAIANTDVYLRPTPSTENDPVGLATKNSRVRIVATHENWYQVDIVEQGRDRVGGPNSTHGWLNGKYVDLQEN